MSIFVQNFLFVFIFASGVRGHRAGPAHSQQILQPGGDHAGERWVKIVSFLIRSSVNTCLSDFTLKYLVIDESIRAIFFWVSDFLIEACVEKN